MSGTGEGVTVSLGAGWVRVGGSSVALGAAVGWVQAVRARSKSGQSLIHAFTEV